MQKFWDFNMFWNNIKIGICIVQDHKKTTSLWINNNTSVKESNTQILAKESITQMDEKINVKVKVIKCQKTWTFTCFGTIFG